MIEYEEYDLLELFENEPQIIGEEEVGRYKYRKCDEYGFTFELYFSIYDDSGSITLRYKRLEVPIFDIHLQIERITCNENKIVIKQKNSFQSIIVYFKPNYFFVFDNNEITM